MGRILNDRRKLCYIKTAGVIVELGCLTGPIKEARVDIKTLLLMITNGKEVYEINPANPNDMVRLTVSNVSKNNFERVTETEEMAKNRENAEKVPVSITPVTTSVVDTVVKEEKSDDTSAEETSSIPEVQNNQPQNNNSQFYQQNQKNGKKNQNDFKKR